MSATTMTVPGGPDRTASGATDTVLDALRYDRQSGDPREMAGMIPYRVRQGIA